MLETINTISQTVAAIAVVASLVYLALQVRQSDRTQGAAALQSVLDGFRDRTFVTLSLHADLVDIFARGLTSLDALDENEKRRFFEHMGEQFMHMQQVLQLYERKLISKTDYDAWLAYSASLVKTPGGAAIWPYIEAIFTPPVVKVINARLAQDPAHPSFLDMVPFFRSSAAVGC